MSKFMNVEPVKYSESITLDEAGLDNLTDDVQDLGDFITLDPRMVLGVTDNVRIGITFKNLLTEKNIFTGNRCKLCHDYIHAVI